MKTGPNTGGIVRVVVGVVVTLLGLVLIAAMLLPNFGYVMHNVRSNEVGVKFVANRPVEVVGSGIYTEVGFFKSIVSYKIEGMAFFVKDDEVLTKDKQRVGVHVRGTVHRPGLDRANIVLSNWSSYQQFYRNDEALVGRNPDRESGGLMQALGQQAIKVCVGDRNFDDAIIGSARDVLRECIDPELDKLAQGYGLEVKNVVVPDVVLSDEVRKRLDEITSSRLATQLANQRQLQAEAEAKQALAVEQGKILVEQGRIQEKALQDRRTAQLETDAQLAQRALIEATKGNALTSAEKDLEIARVNRSVQEENAQAALAPESLKARLYQANPTYTNALVQQAIAGAYKATDKTVIVPAGTNPIVTFGSATPLVEINPTQPARP